MTPSSFPVDRTSSRDDAVRELRGRRIGVLGYGNQGMAQALNVRDAGLEVWVGARLGRASEGRARSDGFTVVEPAALADACDLIAVLTPDETHTEAIASLASGSRTRAIVLAHGFSLRFANPPLRDDWDVLLVAPSGPGTALRRDDRPGRIPAFVAVHRDASGRGAATARAYAAAAGCSESALLPTTVAAEAEIDLFGEQAVLCGGMTALVCAAWETLVDAGYDPMAAYLECVHQVGLTSEMITRHGVVGMRERISPVALYGDLTRGPRLIGPKVRSAMAEILAEIRDGRFAAEWAAETAAGRPRSIQGLAASRESAMEKVGVRLRAAMQSASSSQAFQKEDGIEADAPNAAVDEAVNQAANEAENEPDRAG